MKLRAVVAAFAMMAGACTTGEEMVDPKLVARLHIEVSLGDLTRTTRTSDLTCRTDIVSASGYLAFDQFAVTACRAVTRNAPVARYLVSGPDAGRPCPEVFGGPQTARITGILGGTKVDRSLDRTDGCGIEDWQLLEALLGPP